jgi:hypothetical protein
MKSDNHLLFTADFEFGIIISGFIQVVTFEAFFFRILKSRRNLNFQVYIR